MNFKKTKKLALKNIDLKLINYDILKHPRYSNWTYNELKKYIKEALIIPLEQKTMYNWGCNGNYIILYGFLTRLIKPSFLLQNTVLIIIM